MATAFAPAGGSQWATSADQGGFGAPRFGATHGVEEAALGGLRLRKVAAGMEILWIAEGDPRSSGGAALVQEGFAVGDVITTVDGLEALRMSPDEVLSSIAFHRGGVGLVELEGFRRIPSFPHPSRVPVSGSVPRQAFRPVGEDALHDARSVRATEYIMSDRHVTEENEVARVLLEVENKADDIRRSRGLPSITSRPPSDSLASRGPASSLFAAAKRGELSGAHTVDARPASLSAGLTTSGGLRAMAGEADGAMGVVVLQQVRAAERFIRSDDTDIDGYVVSTPDGAGRETEEACAGVQSLMAEMATVKSGHASSQQQLRDLGDKLTKMNWALDRMGKLNVDLQRRVTRAAPYKWLGLVAKCNMDAEEDRSKQAALEIAEHKSIWAESKKKQDEARLHLMASKNSRGAMEEEMAGKQEEVDRLQREVHQLQDQSSQLKTDLKRAQDEHKVALRNLKQLEAKLETQAREAEVEKIQLKHQRDVFHHKWLERDAAEKNEREMVAGLSSVNESHQDTIRDLQNALVGLRELEANKSRVITEQEATIASLEAQVQTRTQQFIDSEARQTKQTQVFKEVGRENHATISSLTEDLRFLIKRREDDLADMKQVHAAERATMERNRDNLLQQLASLRNDILHQVADILRRLASARVLVSSLRDKESGHHVWETQGGRYPGMHVPDRKIKIHGGGSKVADVSREELEELKTELEEQNGIAKALQTLMEEEKKLQEQLQASQEDAEEKSQRAQDYKLKFHGEIAKTSAERAKKYADALAKVLSSLDTPPPAPPIQSQPLPTVTFLSQPPTMAHEPLYVPSGGFSNTSLPATMPPLSQMEPPMPV